MPSLFDSHEEFNEWFSKDIEGYAKKSSSQPSSLNEKQVQRLHMILKPFMLRRVKKDVESEMGRKEEKIISTPLSFKQNLMYTSIKGTFKNITSKSSSDAVLANYVMQLRKVCNHPELFEEQDVESPLHLQFTPIDYQYNDTEVFSF
jgi:chromatin-remodeling ATPase INO80